MEELFELAATQGNPYSSYQKDNLHEQIRDTERLLIAVHQFKDSGDFREPLKIFNEFKNIDVDARSCLTGIKVERKGNRTIFSSLLKYIKNSKHNINQSQYDFLIKKLEKEDISLMSIYEVFLHRYDFEDLAENLFIMFQGLGNEEEEVNYEANQDLISA